MITRHTVTLIACLATVYLIWGSTFLATKVAVTHLPIALFSAIRFLTAGTLLGCVARWGLKVPWPGRGFAWRHVMITGFLMVFLSNGLNAWAMQFIPSNLSALLNGTGAFWIAGLGVFGPRGHPLSRSAMLGLTIGFAGTVLMLIPSRGMPPNDLVAEIAVLGACLAFSLGTLYYRSIDTGVNPLMFMALQLGFGGLLLLGVALARGDAAQWTFNGPGLWALGYLTLVSSCLAFSAYGWLTRNATPAVIGTYSYVNPAVATLLGWEVLHERLSSAQLVGMVVVIAGVSIVTIPNAAIVSGAARQFGTARPIR